MGFVGAEVSNGLGRKRYYLASGSYKKFLKYDYLDWVQVFLTLLLSKISICLFLLRLSSFRRIRLGLHGMNVFLITSHIPLTFLIIFQCNPISKYWRNPLEGPGNCFDKDTVATIIIIQGGKFSPPIILLSDSNVRSGGRAKLQDSEPPLTMTLVKAWRLTMSPRPPTYCFAFVHHTQESVRLCVIGEADTLKQCFRSSPISS